MKISIDVEMTPEEFRKVLGLPDMAPLQQEMINQIKEQMEAGTDGYDPLTLFRPYLEGNQHSVDLMQKMLLGMMGRFPGAGKNPEA
ncbi:MAG: DUF6489 family protein [Marinobacterium sp.]|nr:DUF6489 family protein [Marinobacterium sp.]